MMKSAMDALQWDNRKWWQSSGYNRVCGNQRVVIFVGWNRSACVIVVISPSHASSLKGGSPHYPVGVRCKRAHLAAYSDQYSSPFPETIQGPPGLVVARKSPLVVPRAGVAADRTGKRRLAGHRHTQESTGSRSSLRDALPL